jgi:ABC-type transport system substrate-binding protein
MLLTKPYARLYHELLQAYRYLNGINLKQQTEDHDKWLQERTFKGIVTRGASGTYIDNPGNMLSDVLNTVAKLVTQAYQNIRNRMGGRVAEIRKATEKLKQHKRYTGLAQTTGNATDLYKNMTEEVGGDLLFTDLRSNKLDDVEREYLKLILEVINENRFGGKKSKEELERMRDTHDLAYYRVPLCKGTAES